MHQVALEYYASMAWRFASKTEEYSFAAGDHSTSSSTRIRSKDGRYRLCHDTSCSSFPQSLVATLSMPSLHFASLGHMIVDTTIMYHLESRA